MGGAEKMRECRNYIDSHLGEELSAVEMAKRYHYSYYHFCRIFQASSGVSVASYIREKRLLRAAESLKDGSGIFEAALDVGFETPSGFVKAFKKKFGCTPTEYQRNEDRRTGGKNSVLSPKFVSLEPIYVLGHARESDKKNLSETKEGAYWFQENPGENHGGHHHGHMGSDKIKIGLWLKEPDEQGNLSYFFGEKAEKGAKASCGCSLFEIPAADYAVFTTEPLSISEKEGHGAFAEKIRGAWKYIYEEWLEGSGYTLNEDGYDFEYYDARCADKNASCMDIYIPVKKQ